MTIKYTNWQIFISALAGASIVLSVSHHFINFWGLGFLQEALIFFLAAPILSLFILLFVNRIRAAIFAIERNRWLFFLFPAVLTASLFAWYFYRAPVVWHRVEVMPAPHSTGDIELYEIKIRPGKVVNLSQVKAAKGWKFEDGAFKTVSENPEPLTASFRGAVGDEASLLFKSSPQSRDVTVILDGKKRDVILRDAETGAKPAPILASYKMGIPAGVILSVIVLLDFLAFFFAILSAWLIQEISQLSVDSKPRVDRFLSHRVNLLILLALALIFHALNFFSVPLITASDSPSYLHGVIHWMEYGNLDGVPAARGPGTTFLFTPAFLLFGKNAAGVKLTLHLLTIGVIPMLYLLTWKLYRRRSFAFFSALIGVFIPELYLFSNFVMSDGPNVFFVLAYCVTLLTALESPSWKTLFAFMLAGTFAVLLRAENILLFAIGAAFLFLKIIWEKQEIYKRLFALGVVVALASLPLLAWSAHNQRVHHFFGLSNYADEVLYDGWVYFGEASGIPITDENSSAVKNIQAALAAYDKPLGQTLVPTGWEIYPTLLSYGYTENQAIKLLGDAARDSIRSYPDLALRVYLLKLKDSFIPSHSGVMEKTFQLVEENGKIIGALPYSKAWYFDAQQTSFYAFIPWQQKIYDGLPLFDGYLYRPFVFFSLALALLAFYQKQFFKWTPMALIVLSRMFIPITIGIAHWNYMLAGIVALAAFFFLAIQTAQGIWASPFFARRD